MQELFDRFIKERTYLKGVAPNTVIFYKDSYRTFQLHKGEFTEQGIKIFVINMREAGVSPGGANAYSRGVNSFLSWMHENGHLPKLKIPMMKTEQRVLKTHKRVVATG